MVPIFGFIQTPAPTYADRRTPDYYLLWLLFITVIIFV